MGQDPNLEEMEVERVKWKKNLSATSQMTAKKTSVFSGIRINQKKLGLALVDLFTTIQTYVLIIIKTSNVDEICLFKYNLCNFVPLRITFVSTGRDNKLKSRK